MSELTKSMEQSCLQLAKQLIEIKLDIKINQIKFEDGSGSNYIFTATGDDPTNWIYIKLL